MDTYLHSMPKKATISISKIFNQEHLMPKAKVVTKNPVDVTDWTREEIFADLDHSFKEADAERKIGTIMTVEEAYSDFRKRSADYNV